MPVGTERQLDGQVGLLGQYSGSGHAALGYGDDRGLEPLLDAARQLMRERIRLRGKGVRLLGLGVSGLERRGSGQGSLFSDPDEERARRLARASDAVRNRMGEKAVTRARLIRRRRAEDEDSDGPEEASSLPSVD